MQCSEVPRTACKRLSPSRAEQPLPGSRLLHGVQVSSRKYGQRVRCIRLPPMDAALRNCGDALASNACAMAGKRRCTIGWTATSDMRASAPMRIPPPTSSIFDNGSALISMMCAGFSTVVFMRSTRFVPPATNFAASRAPERIASGTVDRRTKSNGCMRRLPNGRDDALVGAAAADVAAHPVAYLLIARRVPFLEQRDRGADLSRRAVAALEAVVADERGLHRMELAIARQPFDGHDLLPTVHDGEGEAGVVTPSVDEHGARAARPLVASFLGAGEVEVLAQRVEERGARVEAQFVRFTIHI